MLPDYTIGLTAASAETPDSFEAYKLQVWSPRPAGQERSVKREDLGSQAASNVQAVQYQSSKSQFEELHGRILAITNAIEHLEHEFNVLRGDSEGRHRELSRNIQSREALNAITAQSDKLDRLERTVNTFQSQFSSLHGVLRDSHESLTESLPRHMSNSKLTNSLFKLVSNTEPRFQL